VVHRFWHLIVKRRAGIPLQYLTGIAQFLNMELEVRPGVFIPRPETEELVELITVHSSPLAVHGWKSKNQTNETDQVLGMDLGTGTGCIAIALARELPNSWWVAVDCSSRALAVAQRNARRYGVADRIWFVKGDLFKFPKANQYQGQVDLVVSNPPYIPELQIGALPPEVGFEPKEALNGGPNGTSFIQKILEAAQDFLRPEGELWLEIDPEQVEKIRALIPPGYAEARFLKDLKGEYRFVSAQCKGRENIAKNAKERKKWVTKLTI
jgi:release factor glutamine methyltransferase